MGDNSKIIFSSMGFRILETKKIIFFELTGYENSMLENFFFELSPIGKKIGLTISGAWAPYLILAEKMGRYAFFFGLLVKMFSK